MSKKERKRRGEKYHHSLLKKNVKQRKKSRWIRDVQQRTKRRQGVVGRSLGLKAYTGGFMISGCEADTSPSLPL